ncbi:hypothetical protein [Pedobacter sp. Hv1]|uniref:hypothetical protein n=1 Tax=Pedobacter sp. Hv1 TaxID=1740090 RepID=UPI0006D8A4EE|nr:hypothetical protein [Pedobacter sp. Hv1]KQB98612.1 hypothetical protein AQF98_21465 [Pedobacter sp. Hv1]
MPQFDCIFFLENVYLQIIEVKRNDLASDADISEKFKWLRIEKETLQITPLNFASMDSSGDIEERYFLEGYLKFNSSTGTFIEKYNSAQHHLDRRIDFKIQTALANRITDFLQNPLMATTRS